MNFKASTPSIFASPTSLPQTSTSGKAGGIYSSQNLTIINIDICHSYQAPSPRSPQLPESYPELLPHPTFPKSASTTCNFSEVSFRHIQLFRRHPLLHPTFLRSSLKSWSHLPPLQDLPKVFPVLKVSEPEALNNSPTKSSHVVMQQHSRPHGKRVTPLH